MWMKYRKDCEFWDKIVKELSNVEFVELLNNGVFLVQEEEFWVERSLINLLWDVVQFYFGVIIDKEVCNVFGEFDWDGINQQLDEFLIYCVVDVVIIYCVY